MEAVARKARELDLRNQRLMERVKMILGDAGNWLLAYLGASSAGYGYLIV